MRALPVVLALFGFLASHSAKAEVMVLQAPEGDTVVGVVQAPLVPLRDTIGLGGEARATARTGESFRLLIAQDGWYKVSHPKGDLWTPQTGIRVTTASILRAELQKKARQEREWMRRIVVVAVGVVLLVLFFAYLVQRRRFQEVRRRWILLASRREGLQDALVKAGWDVQTLPADTRMGDFLPRVRPTIVVADQPEHGRDIATLEAHNASVASTPLLWLDSAVVERAQDPSRAFLSRGARLSTILETVQRLAQAVPGPEQLSRRAEIEGKLGRGRLLELLHFLASARRTGRVEVRTSTDPAWMWFEDGQLRHALAGELSGVAAMYHCLDLERGTFAFSAGVTAPEKSIRENTLTLLHEYARLNDEHAKTSRR